LHIPKIEVLKFLKIEFVSKLDKKISFFDALYFYFCDEVKKRKAITLIT
jgi:hypothetical protein